MEIDRFVVSRRVLLEIYRGRDVSSLPEEVRAFLQQTSNPTISMDEEELLELSHNVVETATINLTCSTDVGQANLPRSNSLHPTPPQGPLPNSEFSTSQTLQAAELVPMCVTGPSMRTISSPITVGELERPQKIQPQVHILKRQQPQMVISEDPASLSSVPEASILMIPCMEDKDKKKEKAKSRIPRGEPRVVLAPNTDKGKKVIDSSRPAQKPKKGVPLLIPPKPVLFKKLAQQKFTGGPKQAKNKQAAKMAAEVVKGPDGFFEVSVQYSHCKNLADAIGLKSTDVTEILKLDNLQCKIDPMVHVDPKSIQLEEEGLDLNFDSDEDLLSDEEPNKA